jgi:thiol-disulfide isomerase/thioredoxin
VGNAAGPRLLLAVTLTLSVGLLSAGCRAATSGAPATTTRVATSDAGAMTTGVATITPDRRRVLPALRGKTLTGSMFDSTALRGRVVVYNVWGSWCVPCRAEAPTLRALSTEFTRRGVAFVGVDTRDTRAAALAFERRFGITYPSVFDPDGRLVLTFRGLVPVAAIPSTIVVDRQGRAAGRIIGQSTYTGLKGLLTAVLGEPDRTDSARSARPGGINRETRR